jgi:hypothetical protein
MERKVLGIRLDGRNYERGCVSREFLAHNREETVFLFARLHQVVLLYQGASPYRSRRGAPRSLCALVLLTAHNLRQTPPKIGPAA